MAHQIPTTEPAELRAGDTWQWRRDDLADYPASAWSLTYHFRNAAGDFDVNASADGDSFAVNVAKATTGALTAGKYHWYAFVDNGTERYQVDAGELEVLADVAGAGPYDGRKFAQRMLEAIEARLEGRASDDQLDLIAGTAEGLGYTREPGRDGLLAMRSQFALEVKRVNGTGGARRIVASFH